MSLDLHMGGLFVCFVALRPKSTAMVIAGRYQGFLERGFIYTKVWGSFCGFYLIFLCNNLLSLINNVKGPNHALRIKLFHLHRTYMIIYVYKRGLCVCGGGALSEPLNSPLDSLPAISQQ